MFKVSTKGDYALLLMTALAEKWSADSVGATSPHFVSLKKIAEEKRLSFSYVSQLILPLKHAGLVESKEGLNGGYRLAKDPSHISLMEILEVTEGKISPVKCCNEKATEKTGPCQCEGVCGVKYAWQDAIDMLDHYLRSRKLSELSQRGQSVPVAFINMK